MRPSSWLNKYVNSLSASNLSFVLFVGLVISLFLNTKYALISDFRYILGEAKDFTTIFLYISDILLFLFILSIIFILKFKDEKNPPRGGQGVFLRYFPYIFFLVALLSYFGNFKYLTIPILSLYFLLFLAKSIVLHETILSFADKLFRLFEKTYLVLLTFASILGISQFYYQSSVGLKILGESVIGPYVWGVAKVEALGLVFSRSYALFPHPNIFGAFLTLGVLLGLKFALAKAGESKSIKYIAGVFLANLYILALFLTFSRAAWFATSVASVLFMVFTWNMRFLIGLQRYFLIFASLAMTTIVLGLVLLPLIQQRGNVFDKAYQERKSYNRAAVEMISDSPVVGLGPSQSLIHMKQYLGQNAEPWEVQPIHNYFFLLAAEIGLPSLLLFLVYISAIGVCFLHDGHMFDLKGSTLFVGLCACVVLMLFDHYFFTFQSTLLLFWMWLGFLKGELHMKRLT